MRLHGRVRRQRRPIPHDRPAVEQRDVTNLTLSDGTVIPAEAAVCHLCRTMDLYTDFEAQEDGRWLLTCPRGHQWFIEVRT